MNHLIVSTEVDRWGLTQFVVDFEKYHYVSLHKNVFITYIHVHDLEVFLTYTTVYIAFKCSCDVMYVHIVLVQGVAPK